MLHHELVEFVKQFNVQRYLEIGFGDGINFIEMPVDYKVCISPIHDQEPQNIKTAENVKFYKMPSDIAFKDLQEDKFDMVFIDGMHEYTQVIRDIYNSFKFLKDDGIILIHDVNPLDRPDYYSNKYETPGKAWCGDVWKSVFHVSLLMPNIGYCVIDDQDWPGLLTLWRINKLRDIKNNKNVKINNNVQYPFDDLNIQDARENPDIYNYSTMNDIILHLKSINRGHYVKL